MATLERPVSSRRRLLIVAEDAGLAELLTELAGDAGYAAEVVDGSEALAGALARGSWDAAIVDLELRARNGAALVQAIRARAPSATVIALLPFGGLPAGHARIDCQLAVEKPGRLVTLLAALSAAHRINCAV